MKLRWCRALDLFGSQIPVTQILRMPEIHSSKPPPVVTGICDRNLGRSWSISASLSIWQHSQLTEHTIWNKENWYYCQSKDFSGIIDTARHLRTFRINSKEMLIPFPILCWWYFSFLETYSGKCFDVYIHELEMFSEIFVSKLYRSGFLNIIIAYVTCSIHQQTFQFLGSHSFSIVNS